MADIIRYGEERGPGIWAHLVNEDFDQEYIVYARNIGEAYAIFMTKGHAEPWSIRVMGDNE